MTMPHRRKDALEGIAPPPRKDLQPLVLETPADSAKVQFNVRIAQERATYVKVLAAKLGRQPGDLVEEAINLLEAAYGTV